jgi:mono/diheme cytochrome c family protein
MIPEHCNWVCEYLSRRRRHETSQKGLRDALFPASVMKRVYVSYVVILLLGFIAGATLAGMYIVSRGVGTHEEPTVVEAFVARSVRNFAIPREARNARNPIEASPEALNAAMAHFADHCASCHGNDGRGATAIGRGLYPKPPDMTEAATQQLTDGELYYIIENGVRFTGMPAFGDGTGGVTNKESWDLVTFIRHLPSFSAEEIAEMKKLNPRSPMDLAREEQMKKFLAGEEVTPSDDPHKGHH